MSGELQIPVPKEIREGNGKGVYNINKILSHAIMYSDEKRIAYSLNVNEAVAFTEPEDKRGGIIVFSEEINAVELSKNKIINWIKQKVNTLKNANPKIRANEILVALAIQASSNPLAELAVSKLKELDGLDAQSSSFMSPNDLNTLAKLGIRVTEEPTNFVSKN